MARDRRIRWLHWAPRVLGLLFAAFISLFALDAFGTDDPLWQQAVGFLIHMIPTVLVGGAVIAGWRWPLVGGVLCLGLGLLYVAVARGRAAWTVSAMIAGPIWITGALFFVDGFFNAE